MKNLLILLIPFVVNAQVLTLDVDVLFSTDVKNKYNIEKFEKKLNKDYFNKWDININLIYKGEVDVDTSIKRRYARYIPDITPFKNIVITVISPNEIMSKEVFFDISGPKKMILEHAGYEESGGFVVINSEHFNNNTIAHEICHVFTLKHLKYICNNLMSESAYYVYPKGTLFKLEEYQINRIRKNIKERQKFKNIYEYMKSRKSLFRIKKA